MQENTLATAGTLEFLRAPRVCRCDPGAHEPGGDPWPFNRLLGETQGLLASRIPHRVRRGVPPGKS